MAASGTVVRLMLQVALPLVQRIEHFRLLVDDFVAVVVDFGLSGVSIWTTLRSDMDGLPCRYAVPPGPNLSDPLGVKRLLGQSVAKQDADLAMQEQRNIDQLKQKSLAEQKHQQ